MFLSNNSDAVARFWRNYRILLEKSGMNEGAGQWYVRHAEAYLKAAAGRRLATHTTSDVESELADLGKIGRMKSWQFGQTVDAVRFLFVLIRSPVADAVDWAYWRDSMKPLPDDHPTIARSHGVSASSGADQAPAGSAEDVVARLIAVIRQRNYSIRTEEAYRGWAERFLPFIKGADPLTAGATEVKAFLQALAVEGRVAASTHNQALNALVFLCGKVLERPLGELGIFARAKRPARLPVVLRRER